MKVESVLCKKPVFVTEEIFSKIYSMRSTAMTRSFLKKKTKAEKVYEGAERVHSKSADSHAYS